jgi:uncharacterized protein YkwD
MKRSIPLFAAALLFFMLITAFVAPRSYRVLAQQPGIASAPQIGGSLTIAVPIPKVEYLNPLESEIIGEINLARSQPQVYAKFLEETKKYYSGNQLRYPGRPSETTVEGLAAIDEAIRFLRAQSPLPSLSVFKGMSLAARDHSRDLGTSGNTGHKGSDGSTPNVRVSRYGNWLNAIGENIVYQAAVSARESVMGLIVDDGVAGRGHRKNIFDASYRATGIALGARSNLGTLCVITFAGGFTEQASSGAPTAKTAARKY